MDFGNATRLPEATLCTCRIAGPPTPVRCPVLVTLGFFRLVWITLPLGGDKIAQHKRLC